MEKEDKIMEKTLKQQVLDAADFYKRHAEWERKRAEQATKGSGIADEMMQAAKYNEGRAAAMLEALDLINRYLG